MKIRSRSTKMGFLVMLLVLGVATISFTREQRLPLDSVEIKHKERYKVGEPAKLEIILRNASDDDLQVFLDQQKYKCFKYKVLFNNQKRVSSTS